MVTVKAIETSYHGYHFRSRLEARWAVFFDSLEIPFRYEPEGYDLDGIWYLPDFYLPKHRSWIEIKPDLPSKEEREKAIRLCIGKKQAVAILSGDIWNTVTCFYFDVLKPNLTRDIITSIYKKSEKKLHWLSKSECISENNQHDLCGIDLKRGFMWSTAYWCECKECQALGIVSFTHFSNFFPHESELCKCRTYYLSSNRILQALENGRQAQFSDADNINLPDLISETGNRNGDQSGTRIDASGQKDQKEMLHKLKSISESNTSSEAVMLAWSILEKEIIFATHRLLPSDAFEKTPIEVYIQLLLHYDYISEETTNILAYMYRLRNDAVHIRTDEDYASRRETFYYIQLTQLMLQLLSSLQNKQFPNQQHFSKAQNQRFKPGDRVRHDTFGEGFILKSELEQGTEYVEVEFEDPHGRKRLSLDFANLEKLPS